MVVAALVAAGAATGPTAAAQTPPPQPSPTPPALPTPPAQPTPTPTPKPGKLTLAPTSMIARITKKAPAYATPGAARVKEWLPTSASWGGGPVGLLVMEEAVAPDGKRWLRVQLPGRPNGRSAWVRRSQVYTTRTPWAIEVRLKKRLVTLRRFGRAYRRWRAVIGAPITPTPVGLFAVSERNRQPDPGGFYGPWILRLTSRSEAIKRFDGGPGTVGVHGRGGASLLDPLGSASSHGCVRVSNSAINTMVRVAREGTPVLITP